MFNRPFKFLLFQLMDFYLKQKLINEIPDVSINNEMKDVNYRNFEQTNEIFNEALFSLNTLILESSDSQTPMINQSKTRNYLKPRKKLKTRISCPQILSNSLYPSLEG